MFEARIARDRVRLLDEFGILVRQASVLASQERALGRHGRAGGIEALLHRSEPVVARLRSDVAADSDEWNEVVDLHRILKRELSQADAERVAGATKTEAS